MLQEIDTTPSFPILDSLLPKISCQQTLRQLRDGYYNPFQMLNELYKSGIIGKQDSPEVILNELAERRIILSRS